MSSRPDVELTDVYRAGARFGEAPSKLRVWAAREKWKRYGRRGKGAHARVLFDAAEVEASVRRHQAAREAGRGPHSPSAPAAAGRSVVCPRCGELLPVGVVHEHVHGVRSGVLTPLDRDPTVVDVGDEPRHERAGYDVEDLFRW